MTFPSRAKDPTYQQVVYDIVRQIPAGKVASYGQIARIAGGGVSARMVGYALAALRPGNDVPWQRVINSQGKISLPGFGRLQQEEMLLSEGIEFGPDGHVDWERFGWNGPQH